MKHQGLYAAFLIMALLTLSTSCSRIVTMVAAPPTGGSSSSGFLTSIGSEIRIVEASINVSVEPHPYPDIRYVHTIQIEGFLNVTNPSSENESLLLLYCPSWGASSSFVNETSFEACIEGTPSLLTNQTLTNITHPRELPYEFHDRFPDWVYVHDQFWYNAPQFTMLNLSLISGQCAILRFCDAIIVTMLGGDYSGVGFGLGADQIEDDSTQINMTMKIIGGSQFVGLNPYPYDIVVESQDGDDCIFVWNARPPYSPQLLYGVTPEPIRAGFEVQMVVNEYFPPTGDASTSTSSSTDPTIQIPPAYLVFLVSGLGVILLVPLVIWMRRRQGL